MNKVIDKKIVKRALDTLTNSTEYCYFFDNLKKPDWIKPLLEEGLFNDPPDAEDGMNYPIWPQSRYLVRMANKDPKTVFNTIMNIPETENERIHEDYIKAACAMPNDLASKLAIKEAKWIHTKNNFIYRPPEYAGDLINKLATANQVESAFDLAGALFEIILEEKYIPKKTNLIYRQIMYSSRIRARFETWQYERIIKKCIPCLIKADKINTLKLFSSELENAIKFKNEDYNPMNPKDDYSYIWRPAIEENEQNKPEDIIGILISAVRDIAEMLMDTNGKEVLEFIESDKRKFKIFKRIGLHLGRKWPEIDKENIKQLILNKVFVRDVHYRHEIYHLLKEQYDKLPPKLQNSYLNMVNKEINTSQWANSFEKAYNKKPTQKDIDKYKKCIKYELLLPIQKHLKGEWLESFGELKKLCGEEKHPNFAFYSESASSKHPSPDEIKKLHKEKTDKLINYLMQWEKPDDLNEKTVEGLSKLVGVIVKEYPKKNVSKAKKFNVILPPYIDEFISILKEAIKNNKTFPWLPVLQLCKWVVNQDRDNIPDYKSEYPNNPGWGWTLKNIADLIENGLINKNNEIPYEFKNIVWEILEPLTNDPEPDLEYEKQFGGSNMDPMTMSINTVRGEAMHAVMQYALWIRRKIDKSNDAEKRIKKDFIEMPEVQKVLDNHLNIKNEQTLTIRSLYGRWFPWFVLIDPNWSKNNVKNIFPHDKKYLKYFNAAWGGYVNFCNPYDNVLPFIKKEYAFAIDQIGQKRERSKTATDPEERLAQHLMTYYWRGKLNYDDTLITKFFKKSNAKLRGHAHLFIGRSILNTKEIIKKQILERLQFFWEKRIEAVFELKKRQEIEEEICWFGLWFKSGKFDTTWSFEQLKKILNKNIKIEDIQGVLEKLNDLKNDFLNDVIDCLSMIIENATTGYVFYLKNDEVKEILSIGLKKGNKKIKEVSEETIHRLGSQGFLEYRDLLKLHSL